MSTKTGRLPASRTVSAKSPTSLLEAVID